MTNADSEHILQHARELRLTVDGVEQAVGLFREVIERADGHTWGEASTELAACQFDQGEYANAISTTLAVLDAPERLATVSARAVAGILLSNCRELLEQPVDLILLAQCAENASLAGHGYWSGVGFSTLARYQTARGDVDGARRSLEKALELFRGIESMKSVPGVLRSLAELELAVGDPDKAIGHIDEGLAHLQKYPGGGRGVRLLEDRLHSLRKRIRSES